MLKWTKGLGWDIVRRVSMRKALYATKRRLPVRSYPDGTVFEGRAEFPPFTKFGRGCVSRKQGG